MLRQPKLLCLLSLLLRTFNSLKSAGEQSTEYNSLRLIYFVRFILFAWLFSLHWAAPCIAISRKRYTRTSANVKQPFRVLKHVFLYINIVNYGCFTSLSVLSFGEYFAMLDQYAVFKMKNRFMLVALCRPNSIYYRAGKCTCTWRLHVRLLLNEITSYHDALFRQLTSIFIPFSTTFSVKRLPKRRAFGGKRFRPGRKERERDFRKKLFSLMKLKSSSLGGINVDKNHFSS